MSKNKDLARFESALSELRRIFTERNRQYGKVSQNNDINSTIALIQVKARRMYGLPVECAGTLGSIEITNKEQLIEHLRDIANYSIIGMMLIEEAECE